MADNKVSIVLTATDKTQSAFDSLNKSMAGLKSATAGIASAFGTLGGLGAGLSVAGLASFAKDAIDAADAMNDLSLRTGASVEALASVELAAKNSGTSLESVAKGLNKLGIFMADNADEARKLGLTAKDPVQAFAQLADILAKIEDPYRRASLAQKVLGKSYEELLPLLREGGQGLRDSAEASRDYARSMGELAPKADAFNDRMGVLKQRLSEIAMVAGNLFLDLLPRSFSMAPVEAKLGDMRQQLNDMQRHLAGNHGNGWLNNLIFGTKDDLRNKIAATKIEIAKLEAVLAKPNTSAGGSSGEAELCIATGGRWDGKKCVKAKAGRSGAARAQTDPLASLLSQTDSARLAEYTKLYDLLNQRFNAGKVSALQYAEAVGVLNTQFFGKDMAAYEASLRAQAEALRLDAEFSQADAEAKREAEQANLDYIESIRETEQALLDLVEPTAAVLRELSRLEALRDLPGINQDIVTAAIFKQQEAVDKSLSETEKATKETADFVQEAWKAAAQNIEGALADFLFDPFADGLDGMLDGFVNTLRRMAAEAAAAQIMEGLFGKEFGGGIVGSFVSGIFGGGKAIGGPVSGNTAYLVGEQGPELFVPSVSGTIVPNHHLAKAGINQSITINVSAPTGTVSRDSLQQMQTAVGAATARAMRRNT